MAGEYLNCDPNELLKAAACFQWCISEEELFAADLYVRILDLQALNIKDYTGKDGLATLLADAKCFLMCSGLNQLSRKAVSLYIDVQNAIADGATVPAGEVKAALACYRCLDPETKRNLLLYLKCIANAQGEA